MKLYDCKIAPNPRRVRIFLAEKGIRLDTVEVDILGGENLGEAYRRINPRGLLPLLELDDGTRIDEVVAICRYFEEVQPEPPLLGTDPRSKALVVSRQRHMEFDGMIAASEVFRNSAPAFAQRSLPGAAAAGVAAIPQLVERGRRTLEHCFGELERYLGQSEFVAGDRFSLADITALCTVDFAGWAKIKVPEHHLNTHRWYKAVSARPSAAA
ncbi:MAG: glutathione S-transferase family protein [Nevskia sp.]|nr:glutathione S-transferase family protein [Nevskia sp.]